MTQYQYKALASDGQIVRGIVDADSQEEAVSKLRQRQQYPISTSAEVPDGASLTSIFRRSSKSFGDRLAANFMAALASLLQAGLPLARALELLAGLRDFKAVRTKITAVATRVRTGATLADALQQDGSLSRFVIAMVRAGESGGTLTETSALLAKYLERAYATRQSLLSALLYPAFLMISAILSIGVIMIFVVPAFVPLFDGANKALPLGASILMATSEFLTTYWLLFILLPVLGVLVFRRLQANVVLAERIDRTLLALPLLGRLVTQIEAERFCRVLSVLLANAVPLPTSLDLTKEVLSNRSFRKVASDAAVAVREGKELSHILRAADRFPDGMVDFLRVGEESGDVPGALARQADLLATSTKATIDRTLALAVPLLTIVLGVIVGAIIATLLTAILSINELAT
jgi:general secretion pathway protein F